MRIVSLLLVLVMLLSFAACQTTPVDPVETDGAADSTTPEETTPVDNADIQTGDQVYNAADYLPQEKFDGEDIHIWVDGADLSYDIPEGYFVEGDIVQEAVLKRNEQVATTYNVSLNWNIDKAAGYRNQAELRQSILAGDEYDMLCGPATYVNTQIVYGCFYDMAQSEYIDFSQPWWMHKSNDALKIYDKQYIATGYFDLMTIKRIAAIFFSGPMVTDYRLDNFYEVVEAGEWTWEKMLEYCEIVSEDVNQDGIYDENDKFGLCGRWDLWAAETTTIGYQYVSLDANGNYTITGITDDLLEIHEKIYPVITESNQYYSVYTYGVHPRFPGDRSDASIKMFTNNQILFFHTQLSQAGSGSFRQYGEYGILPSPKYVEGQEDYATATTPYVSGICSTTGDLKISSIILEALQLESFNIVRPAYTIDALSYKYLSDPRAVDMLNLIFKNVTCEWSYNFGKAGVGTELCDALSTQKYLASHFQKNKAAMLAKLNDFVESINAMP